MWSSGYGEDREKNASFQRCQYLDKGPVGAVESDERYLLNITDFRFIKNPLTTCKKDDELNMISFVHSAPGNFKKRDIIRKTWAHAIIQEKLNIKVVFLVGLPTDHLILEALDKEAAIHCDLVQGNFIDSYKNLTYKHIMGYKWVLNYCNNARFVMKADDDAFIDIFNAIKLIKTTFDTSSIRPNNIIACSKFPTGTKVQRKGKWKLSNEGN